VQGRGELLRPRVLPLQRLDAVVCQMLEKEKAGERQEDCRDPIRDRRQEVGAQLAPGNQPDASHGGVSSASLMRRKKVSSNGVVRGERASRPHPCWTASAAISPRQSTP